MSFNISNQITNSILWDWLESNAYSLNTKILIKEGQVNIQFNEKETSQLCLTLNINLMWILHLNYCLSKPRSCSYSVLTILNISVHGFTCDVKEWNTK